MKMSSGKSTSAVEENETLEKTESGKSLSESTTESRNEVGAMALSIDARADTVDIVDGIPDKEVSERVVEGKLSKGDGTKRAIQSGNDQEQEEELPEIHELKIPEKKVMVRKVRIAIQNEILETKKEIKKLEKHPTTKSFELSQAVDMLRKLYAMLQEIAYKSTEFIKNIWLNVSQGKKVSEVIK